MYQTTCALLVLFIALLNCLFNPFFRRTRKGILIVHWTLINYATTSISYPDLVQNPSDLLFLLVSLCVLLEHYSTRHRAGRELSVNERNLFLLVLVISDAVCCLLQADLRASARVVCLVCTVLVAVRLFLAQPVNPYHMNQLELEQIKHDDLFYSWNDPFSCFGRLGTYSLLSVLLNSIVHVSPSLSQMQVVPYIVYILRSVTPLGLLFAPGFFAGTVQSVKSIGRLIGEVKTMKDASSTKSLDEPNNTNCLMSTSNPTVIRLV